MEGRQVIIVVALGAIALGWFIGSGAKGFALPKLPQAQTSNQADANVEGAESNKIDDLWQNVGQNIGQDPQAAIDTVKMWRDRANSEMEYEPAPVIAGTYQAPNYTPMSYGPRFSTGVSQAPSNSASPSPNRSVALGTGFPAVPTVPAESAPQAWPSDVTVSSPVR